MKDQKINISNRKIRDFARADQIATDQKREASKQQVVDLQSIFKGIAIVEPHRFFVKKGAMKRVFDKNQKTTKGKAPKVYLFILFNDLLMYGSPRNSRLVKHVIRVEGLQVAHLPDMQGEWENAISIQSCIKDNHHGVWVCCVATPKAKEKWLQAFKDTISARQELQRLRRSDHGKESTQTNHGTTADNPIEIKKTRNTGGGNQEGGRRGEEESGCSTAQARARQEIEARGDADIL
eukprot:g52966.t1